MSKVTGSCYCSNIRLEFELSQAPEAYNPRACDCGFCRKHGAAYVSDPAGSLSFHVQDIGLLGKYQQDGEEIADFLHCLKCGVLVGVVHQSDGRLYGTVNSLVIDEGVCFGERVVVSPKTLSDDEKIKRWKTVWFSNVTIN